MSTHQKWLKIKMSSNELSIQSVFSPSRSHYFGRENFTYANLAWSLESLGLKKKENNPKAETNLVLADHGIFKNGF